MYLPRQFVCQHRVDHPVTLKTGLTCEGRRYHADREVTFACPWRTGMTRVMMRFVDDLQRLGREGGDQFCSDRLFDTHAARNPKEQPDNVVAGVG